MNRNKVTTLLSFILLVVYLPLKSQAPSSSKIYMPLEFRKAYDNGTRTYDGMPGKNFWQNTCDYKIEATMDPATRVLHGKEWIEYHNNSSNTLYQILFHFYQDVYKKGSERFNDIDEETDGIVLGTVIIDGDTVSKGQTSRSNTFYFVYLRKGIKPSLSAKIEIEWSTQIISKPIWREGFVDSTSAFVGYWYPKIGVYDDIFGWNWNCYNLKDEFYSPLSSYDVSVTLPRGYFVWATGTLKNQENYPETVRKRLQQVTSKSTISIIDTSTDINPSEVGASPWHFHADSVPDFAFCFSNHFLWEATTADLGTKKVLISTVYPKSKLSFIDGLTNVVKKSMEAYSLNDPGIIFPYPYFTSFYGNKFGGIEFPMMAFDIISGFPGGVNEEVFIHEMLHSYVPFYLRTDETKFAWMDEGLTDFYTKKLINYLKINASFAAGQKLNYEKALQGMSNLPLFAPTSFTDLNSMDVMWYFKPNLMYTCLEDALGKETWKKCFAAFADTWKYKSPKTYDFIFFVENYTKRDLFWFWDAWFMHFGYPDLTLKNVEKDKVVIQNTGYLPIPFRLVTTDKSGVVKETDYRADCWSAGRTLEIKMNTSKLSKIAVKCDVIDDFNVKDNHWEH